ncbi:MAG: zinc-binding dehydrogenase, partial [Burkholderiales bacterium]|nr:zinc-binding dehydrogenase [Burkholderiales bacterium]
SGASAPPSPRADVRALRPNVRRDRPHLERLVGLVAAGAVRVPEIRRYRLDEAAAAHAVSEGRHLRGKLVFELK